MNTKKDNYLIDDHGYKTKELRKLPTGGSSNALVGYRAYLQEIAFRKERNQIHSDPLPLPQWEDLLIYDKVD